MVVYRGREEGVRRAEEGGWKGRGVEKSIVGGKERWVYLLGWKGNIRYKTRTGKGGMGEKEGKAGKRKKNRGREFHGRKT